MSLLKGQIFDACQRSVVRPVVISRKLSKIGRGHNIHNTTLAGVPQTVSEMSWNCQGISHSLESGHPGTNARSNGQSGGHAVCSSLACRRRKMFNLLTLRNFS